MDSGHPEQASSYSAEGCAGVCRFVGMIFTTSGVSIRAHTHNTIGCIQNTIIPLIPLWGLYSGPGVFLCCPCLGCRVGVYTSQGL